MRRAWLAILLLAGCSGEAHRLAEMTETVIGPDGGTARSAGGNLTLRFPPGALAKEETITIETIRSATVPGLVSPKYALGPDGLELAAPATLDLSVPGTERSLVLARLEGSGSQPLEGSRQDGDAVHGSLDRLFACGAVEATRVPEADLAVAPPSLRFGVVPVGQSSILGVTVENSGAAAGTVQSVTPPPPFSASWSLPATIDPGADVTFDVRFAPSVAGIVTGTLIIGTSAGDLTVSVSGEGAAGCAETFTQRTEPLVDVLLVVDDSGSMTEEQQSLGDNAGTLLDALSSAGADFHLGVTTTDVESAEARGALVGTGTTATIIDPSTPNPAQVLAQLVDRGNMGSPMEQGLEATELALSEPLATGRNAGFFRPDAWLTIVFLTDEDDGSPEPTDHYLTFLQGLMGPHGARAVQVNAITGGAAGCNGVNGMAGAAPRYDTVVSRTGGVWETICTPPWGPSLNDLGGEGHGYRFAFPLAGSPNGPIEVEVDGTSVPPADYTYDEATRTVVFTPGGTPSPGAQVRVLYPSGC